MVVHLRRTLLLPLDDLLAVTREFICDTVSRSGLDRCLRRHGVGNLNALKPAAPKQPHKSFKSYEPGYLHMDVKYLPQMQDQSRRSYLFVAIDRATRWVFVQIKRDKTAASAKAFLNALYKACPIKISKLLTDNGKEFTDRLFASREREPSGQHEFDQLCQTLQIEHRLTKPRTPKTNGMVERFNGRIADVLKTHRFNSAQDLQQTLVRYVALYNHQLPQSALKSKTPMQAMKDWHHTHPHLFLKRPYDRPGCDTYSTLHQDLDSRCPTAGQANGGPHGFVLRVLCGDADAAQGKSCVRLQRVAARCPRRYGCRGLVPGRVVGGIEPLRRPCCASMPGMAAVVTGPWIQPRPRPPITTQRSIAYRLADCGSPDPAAAAAACTRRRRNW